MILHKVSERRAFRVLGQHRSTQHKIAKTSDGEAVLTADITALALQYGRYGYRRITAIGIEGRRYHRRVFRPLHPKVIPTHIRADNGQSSSPRRYGNGSQQSVPKPPTSCRAVHGKTAIVRASTRSPVTNCSAAKSSIHSRRQRSSSKASDGITTPCDPTHRWATSHRYPKRSSDPAKMDRHQHRSWPACRACTNIPNGSPVRQANTETCNLVDLDGVSPSP